MLKLRIGTIPFKLLLKLDFILPVIPILCSMENLSKLAVCGSFVDGHSAAWDKI